LRGSAKFFAHFGKKSTSRILRQHVRGVGNGRGIQINLPQPLHFSPGFGESGAGFQLSATSVSFIVEFHSIMFANLFHYREGRRVHGWHLICLVMPGAIISQGSLKTKINNQ